LFSMRQTKRPPTPPSAEERNSALQTFSLETSGALVALSISTMKEATIHRRDAVSGTRRERRRMAAILRSDKLDARINKAIQRKFDKVEKHSPPPKIRVRVEKQNRRKFKRKTHRITPRGRVQLPAYEAPIIDRQGRRGIVMVIDYDGAKKHSFGITGRRIIYISDPEHCEIDRHGNAIFFSNMGETLDEILMAADLVELAQRESRIDAKLDVNIIIQLPHDVSQKVRAAILKAAAYELFGRHGLPYAASLHEPDPDGDPRNNHGHICGSWRPMTRIAPYCWEISEDFRSDLDGKEYWRHARRRVAEIKTAVIQMEGIDRHYTHLSNAERGLPHKPQKKLDKRKTRAARAGEFVADVEANRRTIEANVALEKKLDEKRQQRRERSLKRKLAVLARVELGGMRRVDLHPVEPAESNPAAAHIQPVVTPQSTIATPHRPIDTVRVPSADVPTITVIDPAPFRVAAHLRSIVPAIPNPLLPTGLKPVSSASSSFSARLGQVGESSLDTSINGIIKPVAVASNADATVLRPVGPPAEKRGGGEIEPVMPAPPVRNLAAVMQPVEHPAPAITYLQPIALSKNLRIAPTTVATGSPAHGAPRVELVPGPTDQSSIANTVRPVSPRSFSWPVLTPVHPASPLADTNPKPISQPAIRPPVIAKVMAKITIERPVLHPVSAVPSGAAVARLKPVAAPIGRANIGPALSPVHTVLRSGREAGLGPVTPPRQFGIPGIRAVSPPANTLKVRPTLETVAEPRTGLVSPIRPVAPAPPIGIDPALAETMRAFGHRLGKIAASRSREPDASGTGKGAAPGREDRVDSPASKTSPHEELAREVEAARVFIGRVRDKAIHVGRDEEGLILPQRIYWPGNGLTKRGLSDPQVQVELVQMEQRQAAYMKHIHPNLRDTVTAESLTRGSPAIIEKLPEEDRAQAQAWAKTGVWSRLMQWVIEEGEERSRRELRRWRKARAKADGSHFVSAARAQAQWNKWPVDLSREDRELLNKDALQHRTSLAAQQAAARQGGIV